MIVIENKKKFVAFILGVVFLISAIIFGSYKSYKYLTREKTPYEMTFEEAGKTGEKKTYQVVIKISNIASDSKNEPVRGDVIMTAPEDKQWSTAEKEGFLIIKVRLTLDQAMLLTQPKEVREVKNENDLKNEKNPPKPVDSSRKFAIDLAKIGIGHDEVRGKVIADKIFEGEEIIVKK